ncbi:MAG: tyrosine-type recombinase/integrase [Leptolyngbya sp. SIO1E4]|nr:tyrosine-type recombinase/integrase [Leptolyngbya sp. SIO1E4]
MRGSAKELSNTKIIEQWLYGRPRRTQDAYLRDVTQAMNFWDNPPLEAISLGCLQSYQTYLIEVLHLRAGSVKRKISSLRSLLKFAHEQEFIPRNPAIALRSPKVHENLHERILSPQQVRAIIAAAKPGRDRALLLLTYAIGARISEVCGILWKDFTPKPDGTAVVRLLGKRDKWRSVRVPAVVWSEIEALRGDASDEGRVFGLAPRQAHDVKKAAVLKSGAPAEASLHWLRHSAASHSLEAGAPIHVVRDSLGHASIQTTDKYLHSSPEESASDYLNL